MVAPGVAAVMRAPGGLALLVLLTAPAVLADGGSSYEDAEGDATSSAFLGIGSCRDPSVDAVRSGYAIGDASVLLWIEVADADAAYACEPAHFEALGMPWKREVVRSFHLYTEEYFEGPGMYLHWLRDEVFGGGFQVSVYNMSTGTGRIAVQEQLVGDVWSLSVPSAGIATRSDGTTFAYELRAPASFYGTFTSTYTAPTFEVTLHDRFGETFGA